MQRDRIIVAMALAGVLPFAGCNQQPSPTPAPAPRAGLPQQTIVFHVDEDKAGTAIVHRAIRGNYKLVWKTDHAKLHYKIHFDNDGDCTMGGQPNDFEVYKDHQAECIVKPQGGKGTPSSYKLYDVAAQASQPIPNKKGKKKKELPTPRSCEGCSYVYDDVEQAQ